jgi:hypothetical protein
MCCKLFTSSDRTKFMAHCFLKEYEVSHLLYSVEPEGRRICFHWPQLAAQVPVNTVTPCSSTSSLYTYISKVVCNSFVVVVVIIIIITIIIIIILLLFFFVLFFLFFFFFFFFFFFVFFFFLFFYCFLYLFRFIRVRERKSPISSIFRAFLFRFFFSSLFSVLDTF